MVLRSVSLYEQPTSSSESQAIGSILLLSTQHRRIPLNQRVSMHASHRMHAALQSPPKDGSLAKGELKQDPR